jgi:hypothetical protein
MPAVMTWIRQRVRDRIAPPSVGAVMLAVRLALALAAATAGRLCGLGVVPRVVAAVQLRVALCVPAASAGLRGLAAGENVLAALAVGVMLVATASATPGGGSDCVRVASPAASLASARLAHARHRREALLVVTLCGPASTRSSATNSASPLSRQGLFDVPSGGGSLFARHAMTPTRRFRMSVPALLATKSRLGLFDISTGSGLLLTGSHPPEVA